jgi:hypothetical protein
MIIVVSTRVRHGPNLSQSNPIYCHYYFSKIHFNIILLSTPRSPKWSSPFKFCDSYFYALYFFMYVVYMRKYCGDENLDLEILTDLHVLSNAEQEQVFFMPSLCMYVCMYVCQPCQRLDSTPRSYLVIGFEVLIPVVLKRSIFWNITPCSPLKVNRCFGGTCLLHLQGRRLNEA